MGAGQEAGQEARQVVVRGAVLEARGRYLQPHQFCLAGHTALVCSDVWNRSALQ